MGRAPAALDPDGAQPVACEVAAACGDETWGSASYGAWMVLA
jgi:hypothetical protein